MGNEDGSIYDLGDGVLLWEFHSKQNLITGAFREIGWKGLELLEQNDDYVAMVISNDAERFCIGANLMDGMGAGPDGIVHMIEDLQNLAMALRYSPKPVVVAPFNMTFGGGTELMMGGRCDCCPYRTLYGFSRSWCWYYSGGGQWL